MTSIKEAIHDNQFKPSLNEFGAWSFALGTSIGWGSVVVTANTYLLQAGPLGSVLGICIGALIMLIISKNYHYLMNCYPEAGGAYTYTKEAFGYDYGFLTAWFLTLTYMAMFWANATSLPLFARYFWGSTFHFGYLYSLFGYEVYLGEILLTVAAIVIAAVFCTLSKKITFNTMKILVSFFVIGIMICFIGSFMQMGKTQFTFQPSYIPGKNVLNQIIRIATISPWAFIGFENISHATEEFTFPKKKIFRLLAVSVITITILYVFVTLLSVTAYPEGYTNWLAYIQDLGNNQGINALPAFYAARYYLGSFGIYVLMISLLALIVTSLIGNITALSRLLYAIAKDDILPRSFAGLNKHLVPSKAICLIAGISMIIPFLGRTAIGWIVDVTTIGATIIYGFVSASAYKTAALREDKTEKRYGLTGLVLMIIFILSLLLPSLLSTGSLEPESYFLFTAWAIIGFLFFRHILQKDQKKRFGKSIVVWIGLLSLVLFTSLVWMNQSTMNATSRAMETIQEYYVTHLNHLGVTINEDSFVQETIQNLKRTASISMIVVIGLFGLSLTTLLNIYSLMRKRAEESELELGFVKRIANTDPLTGVKSKHAYTQSENEYNDKIVNHAIDEFAIVVCDVNGLKHVNDTYGHKAGDEYIKAACRMVCEIFEHSPVYRIGGDEFVVVLTGRDFENRAKLLDALHQRSAENIEKDEVVVSGGLSDFIAGEDASFHDVFERADARMYQKKKELKALGAKTR